METLKNIKAGDLFYTKFNKMYYFFQIIHITKDLPPPYDEDCFKYGYFIVFFEKAYNELPKSIEELDLINIYKIKYKPENTILYISYWNNVSEIKMDPEVDDYKKYSKYNVKYFGNTNVSKEFSPKILQDFTLPAHHTVNNDGILISQNSVYDISYIFYILENDNINKEKEMKKVAIKMENTIQKYKTNNDKNIDRKELKKCITGINKLNKKYNFITTIDAEELYMKLIKISKDKGILEEEAEKIIEDNRDW
jgi:hypothetical protein